MRILNQNPTIKTLKLKERLNYALIAYNNSIHSVTKRAPLEIIHGKNFTLNISPQEVIVDEYLEKHKETLKSINEQVKDNINKYKLKYSKPQDKEFNIPEQAYVKINKRNSGKIEKQKFKQITVKETINEKGQVIDDSNKKHKLSQLKRPRVFTE